MKKDELYEEIYLAIRYGDALSFVQTGVFWFVDLEFIGVKVDRYWKVQQREFNLVLMKLLIKWRNFLESIAIFEFLSFN